MHNENILALIEYLKALPENRFDMQRWVAAELPKTSFPHTTGLFDVMHIETEEFESIPECKTAACIGGHEVLRAKGFEWAKKAVALTKEREQLYREDRLAAFAEKHRGETWDPYEFAKDSLGLTDEQAQRLFTPWYFVGTGIALPHQVTLPMAIRTLEHLYHTGEVKWLWDSVHG